MEQCVYILRKEKNKDWLQGAQLKISNNQGDLREGEFKEQYKKDHETITKLKSQTS